MAAIDDETPHPVDIHVGARIRLSRMQLNLSQGELAAKVGVSAQAIQKYETGEIRISASRLYEVAQILGMSPGSFFENYPQGTISHAVATDASAIDAAAGAESFNRREIMTLVRGYYGIRDKNLQRDLMRLIARLGNREDEPGEQ